MNLLCFDIASGGISAAIFNARLESEKVAEKSWELEIDQRGAAALPVAHAVDRFTQSIAGLNLAASDAASDIAAICIGTFMHNFLLLDENGEPLTPVFTWLDLRGDDGIEFVRSRLGDRFHEITGCRYHPMFPVFKLAAMRKNDPGLLNRAKRVVSIKALLIHLLTDAWIEDHGIASASGLFNLRKGDWDEDVLTMLMLERSQLPAITTRTQIVGRVTPSAAQRFGLKAGTPVVAGSGDGFFANMGSDCDVPARMAVTLGTSAVVRQTLAQAVTDFSAGTFCYRATEDAYLLGCAGSNGGNVLDWGRRIFGQSQNESANDPPVFIPLLHGERSPDWDPHLTGSWHGLTPQHTASHLSRSILEGVIFNLAHFIEIVQQASGQRPTDLILSGNGFLDPAAAPMLAGITGISTWMPQTPGLGSLRGAGVCALRALTQPAPRLNVAQVAPLADAKVSERYRIYRRLRNDIRRGRRE